MVLISVIAQNAAILSSPAENVKKEKRGIFGFGVHGNHHHHEDLSLPPNHHGPPLLGPTPVNLGAHFHTTVTKKIGIPIPYIIYKPYPIPIDRPVPVPHYVPHPYSLNHHQHSHHPGIHHRW